LKPFWKNIAIALCIVVLLGSAIIWHRNQSRNDRRHAEEVGLIRRLAEQGIPNAQYRLGLLYYEGTGLPQDYNEAVKWYRKGAEQGDLSSQYAIGYMYDTGKGVEQDFAEAARWYLKSAVQGDAQAQCGLGSMYYDGRGVQQDREEAARWYRKAADQGFTKAEYDLGYMYYYGQGVPQDRATANNWYRKAADQGNIDAQHALGVGFNTWRVLILLAQLAGGVLLTAGLLIPRKVRWSIQTKGSTIAGVLSFVCAGLNWYGYTHFNVRWMLFGLNGFNLVGWLSNSVLIVLLIYIWRPGVRRRESRYWTRR
jgi:uncharacterized membrane protein